MTRFNISVIDQCGTNGAYFEDASALSILSLEDMIDLEIPVTAAYMDDYKCDDLFVLIEHGGSLSCIPLVDIVLEVSL